MNRAKFRVPVALTGLLAGALAAPAFAQGVSGPAFYVDGQLYRTVATPTDLSGTGAPEQSYDAIYNFGGAQPNVAEAAPGQPGFNGGRWAVHALGFPSGYAAAVAASDLSGNGVLDYDEEVAAGLANGTITDLGIVKRFVCTVNKVPAGQS